MSKSIIVRFTEKQFEELLQLLKDDFNRECGIQSEAASPDVYYMEADLSILKACYQDKLHNDAIDYQFNVIVRQWQDKINELKAL